MRPGCSRATSAPFRRTWAVATIALAFAAAPEPASATDFHFHGLLDLVASGRGTAYDQNVLTRGDAPFDPYGLRLFADARVNPRLEVYSQVVLRDATTPYVDGAYLLLSPLPGRDLHVLAGKVPWAIGTYAPRTYSNHNPLIGAPLMYQYHSTLLWYELPPSADALLATAGSGQYGANYFGYPEGRGMAIVDDSYWDVGVTVSGSERPLEYALGMTAGTPGWASTGQDENAGRTALGRIGLAPLPGLRVGVSGAYGPYLVAGTKPDLPPGKNATDYHQKLGMADLELLFDHLELRGEAAQNVWESPIVGDLETTAGYVELKYSLAFGGYLAGRWDVLRHGKIANSAGVKHPWDSDVTRIETGIGYRFNREAVAKLIFQRTTVDLESVPAKDRGHDLLAAQLSVAF
jgi:hypothetical protein